MKPRPCARGIASRNGRPRTAASRALSCVIGGGHGLALGLGMVGALLVVRSGVAQTPVVSAAANPWVQGRLTVRPREMATATSTAQTGEFWLDSVPIPLASGSFRASAGYTVYVPPQCGGARRCPLLVSAWAGFDLEEWRQAVDKYGIIHLSLPQNIVYAPGTQDYDSTGAGLRNVDLAVRQVLRRFAIDPDKIAVTGSCATAFAAVYIGGKNPDVFSRIVVVNGGLPPSSTTPLEWFDTLHKTPEILFDNEYWTRDIQPLLRAGYRVKQIASIRDHAHTWEMFEGLARSLQASWATPDPAARPTPTALADPLPLLTEQALAQLTDFWTWFKQAPDSIRLAARRVHLQEVLVPVGKGEERPSTIMADMVALAARYPSVAAALQQAGLTAEQHDAYRLALYSTLLFQRDLEWRDKVRDISEERYLEAPVLEADASLTTNLEFVTAHPDEVEALTDTYIWGYP